MRDKGAQKAIAGAGGVRPLARKLGLPASRVCRWSQVPKELVFEVSRLSGVDAEAIRPDLAEWIDAERHRGWLERARQRLGYGGMEGATAKTKNAEGVAAVMELLDLGIIAAGVRFVAERKGLTSHAIMSAKGGAGGAPTPEQSARTLAMGLIVTVGRVKSDLVATIMGGSRQAVDNAAERYLRTRDGDEPEEGGGPMVMERGRLRRPKVANDDLWQLQNDFVQALGGGA